MEQFTLGAFYIIGLTLERTKCLFSEPMYIQGEPTAITPEKRNITEWERSHLLKYLQFIKTQCQQITLHNSAGAVNEFRTMLAEWKVEDFNKITAGQVAARIDEIDRTIRREMKLHLFMYIPGERAEYYQSWGESKRTERKEEIPLFGNAVKEKFPSIDYDVNEAGNCFATGRYTACVFHLMRILEISLEVFAKVFFVSSEHTSWGKIIEGIEKEIEKIVKEPNKSTNRKEEQEFYNQLATHFRFFKDGWRNYTVHARGKYTDEEAKQIMVNVHAFMQKLATRFSE